MDALGLNVGVCLTFKETIKLFSEVVVPLYTLTHTHTLLTGLIDSILSSFHSIIYTIAECTSKILTESSLSFKSL